MTNTLVSTSPSLPEASDGQGAVTAIRGGYRIQQFIQGVSYDWTRTERCATCNLPPHIVAGIHGRGLAGDAATLITRDLEGRVDELEGSPVPSYRSVLAHLKHHFSGTEGTGLLEARLHVAAGKAVQDIDDPMIRVRPELVAQMALQGLSSRFAQGKMDMNKVSDLISLVKLVREIERDESDIDEAVLFSQAISIVMSEAQSSMRSDDFNALVWRLQSNPAMQDIIRKVSGIVDDEALPSPTAAIEATSHSSDDHMSVVA